MKELLKKYYQSQFSRNVAVMFTGNAISLVIPLLLAPLITRLYAPADFAGYELFARMVVLISVLGALRYDFAIIIPPSEEESNGVIKLCIKVLFIITLLSGVVVIPLRYHLATWLDNDDIAALTWYVPPAVFLTGILIIFGQYLNRSGQFKLHSSNKVLATAGKHISTYLLGFRMPTALGMVLGHIAGLLAPVLALLTSARLRSMLRSLPANGYSSRKIALKYKEFPLYNSVHSFYDEAQKLVLFAIISAYYGDYVLGLFGFTIRYLRIPVQVFAGSLSQVLMPRLANDLNKGLNIRPAVLKIMGMLAAVGMVPFSLLVFFGESLFAFVFDSQWSEAGIYAAIAAPWLFFNFVVSPVSLIPAILGQQRTFLIFSLLFTLITLLGSFILGSADATIYSVLFFITGMGVVMEIFLAIWFLRIANRGRNNN